MTTQFSRVEIAMMPPPFSRKRTAEVGGLEVMSVDEFNKTVDPAWVSPHKKAEKDGEDDTSSPSSENTRSTPGSDSPGRLAVVASPTKSLKRKRKLETRKIAETVGFDNDVEMEDAPPQNDRSRHRPVPLTIKPQSQDKLTLRNPHPWPPSPKMLPFSSGGHSHPRIARTDVEFEEMFEDLRNMIWNWSKTFFTSSTANLSNLNIGKLAKQEPQLIQYLNHVITSSNNFELTIRCHLPIIVYGIIAKSLEVHVFGHEMFGATKAQLNILRKIDIELAHEDSFVRHHTRATTLRSFLRSERTPPRYDQQIDALCLGLHTLVSPLITLARDDLPASDPINRRNLPTTLYYLVERAAYLSLSLRREPDTVYLFLPLSKEVSDYDVMLGDDRLKLRVDSAEIPVETDNVEIKEAGPYHADAIRRPNQPLVPKFLLWPEVQAYRPNSQRRKGHEEAAGLRSRTVCRAQIALGRLETPDEPKLIELIGVQAVRERAYKGVGVTLALGILVSLWKDGRVLEYTAFLKKVGLMGVDKALEGAGLLREVGKVLGRSIVQKRGYWPPGTGAWNRGFNRTGWYSPGFIKWGGPEGGDYVPNLD